MHFVVDTNATTIQRAFPLCCANGIIQYNPGKNLKIPLNCVQKRKYSSSNINQEMSPNDELIAKFEARASFRPKNKKPFSKQSKPFCGEDAFFIAENKKSSVIGVADGVGGWASLGVDPSEFAWQLMDNCKEVVENDDIVDPKEILTKAYNTIVEKRQVKAGSSTACVLSLYDGDVEKGTATLAMANLGDSGFLVIREGTILFASQEQTHFFNAPYQLSIVPPSQSSDNHIKDTPDKSDTNKIEVKNGDIVVLGTDGLFDNLFADEIVSIVKEHSDVSVMGDTLVKKAFERAVSREDSPFAQGARKAGYFYNGGKLDDITVIVAKVHVK